MSIESPQNESEVLMGRLRDTIELNEKNKEALIIARANTAEARAQLNDSGFERTRDSKLSALEAAEEIVSGLNDAIIQNEKIIREYKSQLEALGISIS